MDQKDFSCSKLILYSLWVSCAEFSYSKVGGVRLVLICLFLIMGPKISVTTSRVSAEFATRKLESSPEWSGKVFRFAKKKTTTTKNYQKQKQQRNGVKWMCDKTAWNTQFCLRTFARTVICLCICAYHKRWDSHWPYHRQYLMISRTFLLDSWQI